VCLEDTRENRRADEHNHNARKLKQEVGGREILRSGLATAEGHTAALLDGREEEGGLRPALAGMDSASGISGRARTRRGYGRGKFG